jgi:hypothetical protein
LEKLSLLLLVHYPQVYPLLAYYYGTAEHIKKNTSIEN